MENGKTKIAIFDKTKEARMTESKQLLGENMTALRAALPASMDEKRLCRMAMNCLIRNPRLLEANKASFFLAILNCAEMGLEPGIIQHVALVPYKSIIQVQPMYQGLIELARRSGQVMMIYAATVRRGDAFEYELGLDPKLVHKPDPEGEDNDWTHAYAVAHLKGGEKQFVVMTRKQVLSIRDRGAAAKAGASSPWKTDEEEMAKKTVLKRLLKVLPKSVEMARAIEIDTRSEVEKPQTTDAIQLDKVSFGVEPDEATEPTRSEKPVPRSKKKDKPEAPAEEAQEPEPGLTGKEPSLQEQIEINWQERELPAGKLVLMLREDGILGQFDDIAKLTPAQAEIVMKNIGQYAERAVKSAE